MIEKMTSKSYTVAMVALVIVIVISTSLFDHQLLRSSSFSQGPLQHQTWESTRINRTPQPQVTNLATITCDRSNTNYDICSINGSCNLNSKTGTLTLMTNPTFATSSPPLLQKIRPYPRKAETGVMSRIQEVILTSSPLGLTRSCDITYDSPAIIFSAGGYTGSIYHDFIDGFIPLFITANSVYPDRDFVLVVVNPKQWWLPKYIDILGTFSKHKTILLDKENVTTTTYCFTSATVGLISHGPMVIDPTQIPNSKSLVDFHNLLDQALSSNLTILKTQKPRLILVSRYGNVGRVILNENEMKAMLEDIGFEVIIFRPSKTTNLREAYKLIKSSHVMVGVHGAALTHLLFLRPGSVLVQVVPVGLGWVSKVCFESPARGMKLEYVEYRMNVEESSLIEKYRKDDLVLKDPIAYRGKDWNVTKMNVYLKDQDVRLDGDRFRRYMNEAYDKAKLFMDING